MKKTQKEPVEALRSVNDSPAPSSPEPKKAPTKTEYHITVYCSTAQVNTVVSLTVEELDAMLRETLTLGYSDNRPSRLTIYPAHTINKVEVTAKGVA